MHRVALSTAIQTHARLDSKSECVCESLNVQLVNKFKLPIFFQLTSRLHAFLFNSREKVQEFFSIETNSIGN